MPALAAMGPALAAIGMVFSLLGCTRSDAGPEAKAKAPAVRVDNGGIKETDLAKLTLSPPAERRLGIRTELLALKPSRRWMRLSGEFVVPPGQALLVSAPVASTVSAEPRALPAAGLAVKKGQSLLRLVPLVPLARDLLVTARAELTAAEARAEAAGARHARAKQLLADRVGSQRAVEAAEEEERVARAALDAARARLHQVEQRPLEADVSIPVAAPADGVVQRVHAAPGQQVAAGAPLIEIAGLDPLWIRVPVYSGELSAIDRAAPARAGPLPGNGPFQAVRPVAAPPTAGMLTSTTDLYYVQANPGGREAPGERRAVELPLLGRVNALQIPWSAVLYDIHGAAWVYQEIAPQTYARRRVEVERVDGGMAVLSQGPEEGSRIVVEGAAELFGSEFGAGK